MNCQEPGCEKATRVIDSRNCPGKRDGEIGVRRRRECEDGHRFTTYECHERNEVETDSIERLIHKLKRPQLVSIMERFVKILTEAA